MSALLDIRDLDLLLHARPPQRLLRRVSLQVSPGQIVGLVGESGAGKTMVSRVVLGIAPANARVTHGTVTLRRPRHHASFGSASADTLLGREIAFIPQNPMTALNPVERIEPQITDVLRMHLNLDRTAARTRALALLREVHLREPERILRQYPHELSGGMRQRVLIAIAFACKPKLVIADEPTTALDVTVQKQILQLIRELQRNSGTAILFITHDLGVVAKLCDWVAVMHGGRVLESARVAELFAKPVARIYPRAVAATPRFDRPAELLQPIPAALTRQLDEQVHALDSAESGFASQTHGA